MTMSCREATAERVNAQGRESTSRITPSAFVLPTEQTSENKTNLILPCLLRHLDRAKTPYA